MKKILSGIITIVVIVAMATSVKAASIGANKTEVKKGEEVVVSVNLNEDSRNIDVTLTYDASKFEYVKDSATSSLGALTVNAQNPGTIIVAGSNTTTPTKQVSFTFKAKETTDAVAFKASDLVTEGDEELTSPSVNVKVVEENKEPEQPQEPSKDPVSGDNQGATGEQSKPASDNKDKSSKEEVVAKEAKVDANGNKITKLPQTGVPYIVCGSIIAVVVIVAIIAKRNLNK